MILNTKSLDLPKYKEAGTKSRLMHEIAHSDLLQIFSVTIYPSQRLREQGFLCWQVPPDFYIPDFDEDEQNPDERVDRKSQRKKYMNTLFSLLLILFFTLEF